MPAEHLRALIDELHPGVSVRQLTRAAGGADNLIAYYLRPGTEIKGIPQTDTCKEIARILGCDVELVVEGFAADAGTPLPQAPRPDPVEDRLLWIWRRLPEDNRELISRAMVTGEAIDLLRRYLSMSADDQFAMQQITKSINGGV